MALPIVYNVRNVANRRVGTALTAFGIGLVIFVFIWFLALANGFRKTLVATGRPDNVIVVRKGAQSEVQSFVSREGAAIIRAMPAVAIGEGDRPIASAEIVTIANIPKKNGAAGNVTIRGVSPDAFVLRPFVKIVEGRLPQSGLQEVIVGRSLSRRYGNMPVGGEVRFGKTPWKIVGMFEADGGAFESELWGDAEVILSFFEREGFQSMTFRLKDPSQMKSIIDEIGAEPRLQAEAHDEVAYYAQQSGFLGALLASLGTFIAVVMSVGAVFGALNTMFAAVDQRTREIGTLLAIGFSPISVYMAFVMESLLIALVGGVLGILLALPFNGISTGTTNWTSFSELAFQFQISTGIMISGLVFAAILGVVGGLLPAWRAARQPVAAALRAA